MVAAGPRAAVNFLLSAGNVHDAAPGRELLKATDMQAKFVIMDRAYEGYETRQLILDLGMTPVVPPKINRITPWEYDREMYKKRNEVERLFRRLKGYRRIFSRFDKLDVVFMFFIYFALITDTLFSVNTP
jgi:transposase